VTVALIQDRPTVRGNPQYGINNFDDNGDGTVTDTS